MDLLFGIYVLTAIFGVGVVVVDVSGLLGDGDSDDGGHPGGGDDLGDGAHAGDAGHHGAGQGSILNVLGKLRTAVYFCFGFGLLGLAAMSLDYSGLGSLLWSVPGGIVTALMARALLRFQQRDVDSSYSDDELLAVNAEVLIGLDSTDMGRIRARLGQFSVERYALAEDPGEKFQKGDTVQIVRVADDCVHVRAVKALEH